MMLRRIFVISILSCALSVIPARASDSTEVEKISYIPEVFGAVKAKFETSLYDGAHRFNVRNSRIGVRGFASPKMKYAVQIDFSNEGKLAILDSYATYFTDRLEITLGQQQYRFSTDLDRGPNTAFFANRSMLAKFLTTYYTSTLDGSTVGYRVSSIGSRDLGVLFRYRFTAPLRLSAGLFNGSGTNNPEWDDKINVVARLEIGRDRGLHGAIAHYNGHTPANTKVLYHPSTGYSLGNFTQRMRMWGGEISYSGDNFTIETEYAQRRLKMDGLQLLQAGHIQGFYQFMMPGSVAFTYVAPVARWDIGDGIEFLNTSGMVEQFTAHRATAGVNIGFTGKIVGSELRIQFEKYFVKNKPSDYSSNRLLQDKVTIEIVASF